MAPEGAAGSRRERNSDVEVLHCRSIEMLGSLAALTDYRPTLSTTNVRGRRLALGIAGQEIAGQAGNDDSTRQ